MTNPAAKKRLTLVAAIVAVAIISVAVFTQFGEGPSRPSIQHHAPSSTASPTQTRSTSNP